MESIEDYLNKEGMIQRSSEEIERILKEHFGVEFGLERMKEEVATQDYYASMSQMVGNISLYDLLKSEDRDLVEFITDDEEVTELNYPVLNYPDKVKSLSFDKTNRIEGKLLGIKGQYLLFDQDRVINMRKHVGYKIQLITHCCLM